MQQEFRPSIGASILDICLNCYMTLNMMPRLVADNSIEDLNKVSSGNEVYLYDTDFIDNEFLSIDVAQNGYQFVTGDYNLPSASFVAGDYLMSESSQYIISENNDLTLI